MAEKIVSRSALISRINRKLAHEGERLRVNRHQRWYFDLGWYYVVGIHTNLVEAAHLELPAFARELGVLRPGETAADC